MNTEELKERIKESLKHNNKEGYSIALSEFLNQSKFTEENLEIILDGIELDKGHCFVNFLNSKSLKDATVIWKVIKDSDAIKTNTGENGLKMISTCFCYSLSENSKFSKCKDSLFTFLISLSIEKDSIFSDSKISIINEYLICNLPKANAFPIFDNLNISPEKIQLFANRLLGYLSSKERNERLIPFIMWLNGLERLAVAAIKEKKIKEQIPVSKISNLEGLVSHYKDVESRLEKSIRKIAFLEDEKTVLSEKEKASSLKVSELEKQVESLRNELESYKEKTLQAQQVVDTQQGVLDSFDSLKKNEEIAILKNIASALQYEYKDFYESVDDEMDVILGEIYKEKIISIFKILDKLGITMGD